MNDKTIFREVDDELRQQKYKELWSQYGKYAIITAIAVIGFVGGTKIWQSYQISTAEKNARQFFNISAITQNAQSADSEQLNQFTKQAPDIYREIALFKLADITIQNKNYSKAAEIYQNIEDTSPNPQYKNLAAIKHALLIAETNPQKAIEKVEKLNHKNNIWKNKAREIIAIAQLKNGNIKKAKEIYQTILQDPDASPSIQNRAENMLKILRQKIKINGKVK